MSKILLINPIQLDDGIFGTDLYPPIGLAQLSTHYKNKGWEVELWDQQIPNTYKIDKNHKPDKIGISVMIGQPLRTALQISKRYHKWGIPIVWGGAVARITPYLVPDFVEIDPNYYDEFPDYDILDMNLYEPAIYTSTGCNFRCSFCYHNKDQEFKTQTLEEVMHHVSILNKRFGIKSFKVMDDNFFTDKDRAIAILNEFKREGYKIRQVHSNINCFNDDVVNACKGVVNKVGISIEHGEPSVRKELFNKPMKEERIFELVDKFKKLGISTIHNFIFGSPAWQLDLANFKLADKIREINPQARLVGFSYASMPETPLTKQIEEAYGEFPKTLEFWQDFIMEKINIKYNPWTDTQIATNIDEMTKLFNDKYGAKHD